MERKDRMQSAWVHPQLRNTSDAKLWDDESQYPERVVEQCRTIPITIPDYFERDQVTKKIQLTERVKKYGLVFDKRVIDPATRVSTPYGYNWFGADVELLLSL